ncbi:neuronal synaptobrevin isoform X2 [Procambarus clarkii]|uniref:neuronal synaptobrevin isoform X2 n=1 Tax=Procambarus clarkii TaxID=6728 RepID=UPI003742B51D
MSGNGENESKDAAEPTSLIKIENDIENKEETKEGDNQKEGVKGEEKATRETDGAEPNPESSEESAEGGAAVAGGAAPGGDPPTGENGEIVGGPRGPQQVAAQKRMQQTQAQVDEVVDIMRTNVEKVLERDQKLSELDDRADALQQGASQFEQQAGKLKRKMWWKNLKMMIIMGVIGIIVLIIIVGPYLPKGSENKTENVVNTNAQPINPTTNTMMNNANNAPHSFQSSWA